MKLYNEEHEWLEINGDIAILGISAYAVEQLGDITFVELPEIDTQVSKEDSVAFVESVKAASDIFTPVSGEIIEINENLLEAPESLNEDALNIWVFKIKLSDESELESLMNQEQYDSYIQSL